MRLTIFATILFSAASAAFGQISADLLIKTGDAIGSSTLSTLSAPFTNGLGQVGFNGGLADGSRSVWFNGGEIFNSASALPDTLSGGESTMGIGNNGEFIYSPSFNGGDSVWGQSGLILVDDTPAPDFPANVNSTFHSRPQMTDDGSGYWISGFNDGAGGTSTIGRMLYRRAPDNTITTLIRAGEMIDGLTVSSGSGVGFDYHVSGNNVNVIVEVNLDTGSTSDDGRQLVNKTVVAAEGAPTGQGDNWDNFDISSINDSGNYVFSGDTDGPTSTDEFIAYNGAIQIREGDVISAGTLDGSVNAVSINNLDQSVFIWALDDAGSSVETLFFAADSSNMTMSQALASVGDTLDVDNDGIGDWILTDFNASGAIGPGLDFAENGLVYVEVDLDSLDGMTSVEAIVSFVVPEPSCLASLALGGLMLGVRLMRRKNG